MAMIYCRECGARHSEHAKACPKCGYAKYNFEKNTLVYVLLAFFLGSIGIHRFYAGKKCSGISLLIMGTIGWILIIPGIISVIWALIDFIKGLINLNKPEKIFD